MSFPTCQVRVSRFYQRCIPPLPFFAFSSLSSSLSSSTASARSQWAPPDLNRELHLSAHVGENVSVYARRNGQIWYIIIYMYIYIQYILLYTSRWYARIYVRMMCVDHSKKVIIYLIFVSFNYYTHFLYKHSDISRWMVWATAPRENGTQERSPRVSFDMGRPAQELSWNALRWRWGHTPSLGVQGMGFLGETRHVCFAGMCIYCILVYAYITAHYCTCTCTVHLHQIYKSICRYVYQHIW